MERVVYQGRLSRIFKQLLVTVNQIQFPAEMMHS
jgi:hypothetical protein